MPDLIRHPEIFAATFLDSGLRRNDDSEVFNCRSNIASFLKDGSEHFIISRRKNCSCPAETVKPSMAARGIARGLIKRNLRWNINDEIMLSG